MGKDKEMSKDDLVEENGRLSGEVSRLQAGLEEVEGRLKGVESAYQQSKAAFSLARYGQLKDIIKQLTSEESLRQVRLLTENQTENKGKGAGMTGLMQRARQFAAHESGGGAAPMDQPAPQAAKSGGGKLSGLFKKIKYATGFSEHPPDIYCLSKEEIRGENDRKRREIRQLTARGLRAHGMLQRLKERYQASKKHAPPTRYQDLKDMIKDVLAEKF